MTVARGFSLVMTAVLMCGLVGSVQTATNGAEVTVAGWVLDSACAYTKGLDKPVGVECAKECAKNGSPLVILRADGTIFLPIDDKTPASSMNAKLMPFAGERVTVVGKDYVRNGSHALIIEKISRLH